MQHRQVALERRLAEVLVHRVEAGEQLAEPLGADREHRGQADRRVHRVAPADPVPEAEHVGRCRCRTPRTSSALVETATKCLATAASSPERAQHHSRAVRALVIVSSVVKVLEQTTNSVSAGSRSRVASAKSVPSTLETKRKRRSALGVVAQRLVRHHRPQVRAADADVDDVADRLAGVAEPLAAAHALANSAIRSSTSCTSGTTSSPSTTSERPAASAAPRAAPARFSVTLICSPRNIASRRVGQVALLRQLDQQPQRLVRDALLGVVEVEPGALAPRRSPRRDRRRRASRRWIPRTSSRWRSSASQEGRSVSGVILAATSTPGSRPFGPA